MVVTALFTLRRVRWLDSCQPPQSAMNTITISFMLTFAKISSPASIMLFGTVLVGLALGLRKVNRPS